jgi:hypothetical protein
VVEPRCDKGVVPVYTLTIKSVNVESESIFRVRCDIPELAFLVSLFRRRNIRLCTYDYDRCCLMVKRRYLTVHVSLPAVIICI